MNYKKLPYLDRFLGCLIGQCLGDALGAPVEGQDFNSCRWHVENIIKAGKATKLGRGRYGFGQYTDDSQLAREMIQSYVNVGYFDPGNYAERIAAIFKESRIVGGGRATRLAAERLIDGISWDNAGTPSPSAGNGSAMRAAPIGLMFFDDLDKLIQAAHDQSRITHKDPRCTAGSIAIAGSTALVLRGLEHDNKEFFTTLSDLVRKYNQTMADGILKLPEWKKLDPEDAVNQISLYGVESEEQIVWWDKISPFVIPSVLWSIYSFLKTPDDYLDTVCTAIWAGGDVDTTAAMAGAISGACLGINAIPLDLAKHLNDKGKWGFKELIELAEKSYEIKKRFYQGSDPNKIL